MNVNRNHPIVVGIDESALHGPAIAWAAEQAQLEGRRLQLINGSGPISSAWSDRALDDPAGDHAGYRQRGLTLLAYAEDQVRRVAPGLQVEQRFEVVDPAIALVAASGEARLVVLGSRGRG